jgi:uncharacterized protein (DUF2345 family)
MNKWRIRFRTDGGYTEVEAGECIVDKTGTLIFKEAGRNVLVEAYPAGIWKSCKKLDEG